MIYVDLPQELIDGVESIDSLSGIYHDPIRLRAHRHQS